MVDLNNVNLLGRATKDVEIRTTTNGTDVAEISLAVNGYKDEASFFELVAFGKTAEIAGKYVTKGKQIAVTGSLKQDSWDDKETGKKRSKVVVIVNSLQLLGGQGEAKQGDVVIDDIDDKPIDLSEIPF